MRKYFLYHNKYWYGHWRKIFARTWQIYGKRCDQITLRNSRTLLFLLSSCIIKVLIMNTEGYYIKRTRMSDHSLEMRIFFFGLKCILDLLYLMLYDWHSVFLFWHRNAISLLKTNSNRKNKTFKINISIIEIHVNNDILEAQMFENGSMILMYVNRKIYLNTHI